MKILAAQGEIEHADNSGINGCRMLYFECRRDHSGRVREPKNVDQPSCIASLGGCDGIRQAIDTSRPERQAQMKAPPVVCRHPNVISQSKPEIEKQGLEFAGRAVTLLLICK